MSVLDAHEVSVTDIVLEAHDYDPEGTWWVLRGRGPDAATYSIWDVRNEIRVRLTPEERRQLDSTRLREEQIVRRLIRDDREIGDPDRLPVATQKVVMSVSDLDIYEGEQELAGLNPDPLAGSEAADPETEGRDLAEDLQKQLPVDRKQAMIAAIQEFARREGRPPKSNEGVRGFSNTTLKTTFGSWADAIEAAGFERPTRGGKRNGTTPTKGRRKRVRKQVAKPAVTFVPEEITRLAASYERVERAQAELQSARDELEGALEEVRQRAYA